MRDIGFAMAFIVSLASAGFAYLSWADGAEHGRKLDKWQAEASQHREQTLNGVRDLVGLGRRALDEMQRRPEETAKIFRGLVREQEEVGRRLLAGQQQGTTEARPARASPLYRPLDPRQVHGDTLN